MHEWKVGDLGVARDRVLKNQKFATGTVMRFERHAITSLRAGYWSIVFGPAPEDSFWFSSDLGLWWERFDYVDPLPEGDK